MKKKNVDLEPATDAARPGTERDRAYYRRNRQKILKRRRQRYKRDPEYRAQCKKRALNWYRDNSETARPKAARRQRNVRATHAPPRRVFIMLEGRRVPVRVLLSGELAAASGIPERRLRRWQESGILPRPAFLTAHGGWRLYTEDQAAALRTAIAEVGVKPGVAVTPAFRARLEETWGRMVHGLRFETIKALTGGRGDGEQGAGA